MRVPGGERRQARPARAPRALAQSQPGALLRAHQARCVAAGAPTGKRRSHHVGDPRRQGPESAARGARGVQGRQAAGAGRHRRRCARPRHRRPAAGRQLRNAVRARRLHPPHRPYRARRPFRRGDFVRCPGGGAPSRRGRAPVEEGGADRRRRRVSIHRAAAGASTASTGNAAHGRRAPRTTAHGQRAPRTSPGRHARIDRRATMHGPSVRRATMHGPSVRRARIPGSNASVRTRSIPTSRCNRTATRKREKHGSRPVRRGRASATGGRYLRC